MVAELPCLNFSPCCSKIKVDYVASLMGVVTDAALGKMDSIYIELLSKVFYKLPLIILFTHSHTNGSELPCKTLAEPSGAASAYVQDRVSLMRKRALFPEAWVKGETGLNHWTREGSEHYFHMRNLFFW